MERIKMIASEGMILTDGEIYGREIFLSIGDSTDRWTEITEAEYSEILRRDCDAENLH